MITIGQRVVCIHDYGIDKKQIQINMKCPDLNKVYTIRDIRYFEGDLIDSTGVLLKELVNPLFNLKMYGLMEPYFSASFFRPLDEKRIDQFRSMLTPSDDTVRGYLRLDKMERHRVYRTTIKPRKGVS